MSLLLEADLAPSVRSLDFSSDAMPLQKVMGLQWDPEKYMLARKLKERDTPLMKHGILQRTHLNFDPLGFSSVLILKRKLIFQDLCMCKNLGWMIPFRNHISLAGISG